MNEKVDSRKIPIFHYIKWITTFAFSSHSIVVFVITVFARYVKFFQQLLIDTPHHCYTHIHC